MADTTTQGHAEAVKAVAGQLAPEVLEQKEPEGVRVTRDLKSEQQKDEKLDKEVLDAMGGSTNPSVSGPLGGEEREQRAVRTLANGKTEALLEKAPVLPPFPPDDGGYNPEKRTHAGPAGTKVPSAVGKNVPTVDGEPIPVGWRESDFKNAKK